EVDRGVADEVDGADHVVPRARLEELGDPVLAAAHVVGLDAQPQVGVLAHEAGVGVDVVGRPLAPPRVLPDLQRLAEPVDVLGDAELGDAVLLGGGPEALGVARREVLAGGGALVVGAEVDVVVGQHRRESASARSWGVVTLKLAAGDSTTRTVPPARSTSQASSVA